MNNQQKIHPELQPDFKPEVPEEHHLPAWVWITVIAIIGLLVIGLVAYGAYQYLSSNDQDGCITLYEPVCGINGTTYSNFCAADLDGTEVDYMGKCEVDEFEDWLVYRNEEHGFEVKYPKDWSVRPFSYDSLNYPKMMFTRNDPRPALYLDLVRLGIYQDLSQLYSNEQSLPLEDWLAGLPKNESTLIGYDIITLDNFKVFKVQWPGITVVESAMIEHKGKVYNLSIEDNSDEYTKQIFDQILSTFKFID